MLLLTILLSLLFFIDLSAIVGGYFEIPFYYWYSDETSDILLLFRDKVMDDYEAPFVASRNMIITLIYFSVIWSLFSVISSRYFSKRRYGALQWPLSLWKIATFLMALRLIVACIVVYKFHYELIYFENITQLVSLYREGIVGIIPALLFVSILINITVMIGSIRTIMNTSEWYRLNIAKRL